jgi:hypothetical protein
MSGGQHRDDEVNGPSRPGERGRKGSRDRASHQPSAAAQTHGCARKEQKLRQNALDGADFVIDVRNTYLETCWFPGIPASSTGRCNTIQWIDLAVLPRENYLFGCTRPKPRQSSVPAGLTLASDFRSCLQCKAGSNLVLRRPIEITPFIGRL